MSLEIGTELAQGDKWKPSVYNLECPMSLSLLTSELSWESYLKSEHVGVALVENKLADDWVARLLALFVQRTEARQENWRQLNWGKQQQQ